MPVSCWPDPMASKVFARLFSLNAIELRPFSYQFRGLPLNADNKPLMICAFLISAVVVPATDNGSGQISCACETIAFRARGHDQFVGAMGIIKQGFWRHVLAGSSRSLSTAKTACWKLRYIFFCCRQLATCFTHLIYTSPANSSQLRNRPARHVIALVNLRKRFLAMVAAFDRLFLLVRREFRHPPHLHAIRLDAPRPSVVRMRIGGRARTPPARLTRARLTVAWMMAAARCGARRE